MNSGVFVVVIGRLWAWARPEPGFSRWVGQTDGENSMGSEGGLDRRARSRLKMGLMRAIAVAANQAITPSGGRVEVAVQPVRTRSRVADRRGQREPESEPECKAGL